MYEVSVKGSFSAAHFLKNYRGKCENLHGHNWDVEVTVKGMDLKNGILMDFTDLKKALNEILDRFDHKLLNDMGEFRKVNTTSENIAKVIFDKLKAKLPKSVSLEKVEVSETSTNRAAYRE